MPRADARIRLRLARHQGRAGLSGGRERVLAARRTRAPAPTDAPAANAARLVAVLADGMGGHTAGALASRMVCESFVAAFAGLNGSRPERLLNALRSANDAIAAKVEANPVLSGMGSTLVAAVLSDDGVEWVSVGDSPLLLFRRGEIAHSERGPFARARARPARRDGPHDGGARRRPTRAATCCARP